MSLSSRKAVVVAGVLTADAALHVYWSTGATWPASDHRSLSQAVLGGQAPFTPGVVLPLAALLLTAAGIVYGRARRGAEGWLGRLLQAGTLALAAGLLARALVGIVWACGVGVEPGGTFYWLNLAVYTPLCLALGGVVVAIAREGRAGRAWPRRVALGLPLLLVAGLLSLAYGYQPAEQRDYRPGEGSQYVDTPVARFHYVRQGAGSPVVLLSPGMGWTFAWREQAAALAREHTVYTVDLPGQGFTELRDRDFRFDLDGMTGAVHAFLDAVGVSRAALAGNSWSGGWALAYAQRHPERVSHLLLLAASGLDEPDPWSWEILKLPVLGELLTKAGSGRSAMTAAASSLFHNTDRVTADVAESFWAPNTFADNLRSIYELERGLDWRMTDMALSRTVQPALIIWGADDSVLPVAQAATFGRRLPAAQVHVLDGCGHALTLDCPDQVTTLMREFLRER